MMSRLHIIIPVLAILLCIVLPDSVAAASQKEVEHSGLHEAEHNHDASHSHEDHHHHGHSHKASPEEKAELRVGEIVFSIVFCLCVALIIYVIVKRRWA
jgi:ABC-type nickel/cobalt efflux system permease component RcnA